MLTSSCILIINIGQNKLIILLHDFPGNKKRIKLSTPKYFLPLVVLLERTKPQPSVRSHSSSHRPELYRLCMYVCVRVQKFTLQYSRNSIKSSISRGTRPDLISCVIAVENECQIITTQTDRPNQTNTDTRIRLLYTVWVWAERSTGMGAFGWALLYMKVVRDYLASLSFTFMLCIYLQHSCRPFKMFILLTTYIMHV